MNMACTFWADRCAVPAFSGTKPLTIGQAIRKQGRACNRRFLILRDQIRPARYRALTVPAFFFGCSRRHLGDATCV
jgi:hypothetical protein